MVKNEPTFLHSCILDGTGGAKFVDASSVAGWTKDQGVLWVHLDVNDDASRLWLAEHGGLDSTIVESLLADETRPRSYSTDSGLLTVLRGVNTNPGEDPEDMVSVRLWIEPDRIISTRRRRAVSWRPSQAGWQTVLVILSTVSKMTLAPRRNSWATRTRQRFAM
jgi:zinc transporter